MAVLALPMWQSAAQVQAPKGAETFTYKEVEGLEIKLDVYRAEGSELRPVVVWIHGGALINGGRQGVSGRVKKMAMEENYVLVSLDYRLAPETKGPAIIEDLEDAFRWIHKNGKKLLQADVNRVAVMGGSAGGHLTLTAGFRVKPAPDVLVSYWGYGDLVGPWLSEPSPHARHQSASMSEQEARAVAAGPPVANAGDRAGDGGAYYQRCRRTGTWPLAVLGFDPKTEDEKFTPFMAVRNVTENYPPTLMIHGSEDTDVPFEQSVMMAAEFRKHGVEHRLIEIKGGEHGLRGGDAEKIEKAHEEAVAFVKRHLEGK